MGWFLPKRGLVRTFTFSLEDTQRIIASASETVQDVLFDFGRDRNPRGEICALRVADLDLESAVIHVRQSVWRGQIQTVKSRKGNRRFPISAELVERLRAFLVAWRPNVQGVLFATRSGHAMGSQSVRKRKLHPLLKKLGIPRSVGSMPFGTATRRFSIRWVHRWQFGSIG